MHLALSKFSQSSLNIAYLRELFTSPQFLLSKHDLISHSQSCKKVSYLSFLLLIYHKMFYTSKSYRQRIPNGYRDHLCLSIYRRLYAAMPALCHALEWCIRPMLSRAYTIGQRFSHNVQQCQLCNLHHNIPSDYNREHSVSEASWNVPKALHPIPTRQLQIAPFLCDVIRRPPICQWHSKKCTGRYYIYWFLKTDIVDSITTIKPIFGLTQEAWFNKWRIRTPKTNAEMGNIFWGNVGCKGGATQFSFKDSIYTTSGNIY